MAVTVRPLTEISAGGAQVFDLSGFSALQQEKNQKEEQMMDKVMASTLEYDPTGLFQPDLPEYQKATNEYLDFVKNNSEALANPSENLELWQQKKQYENRIKNYVAASKQYNQQIGTAVQMFTNTDKYRTTENGQFLSSAQSTGHSWEEFKNGNVHEPVLDKLSRNLDINYFDIAGMIQDRITTVRQEAAMGDQVDIAGKNYSEMTTKQIFETEKEAAKEALATLMNKGGTTSKDLQEKYAGEEDPLEAFYNDVMKWVRKEGNEDVRLMAGASPTSTKADDFRVLPVSDEESFAAITKVEGSGDESATMQINVASEDAYSFSGLPMNIQGKQMYDLQTGQVEITPGNMTKAVATGRAISYRNDTGRALKFNTNDGKSFDVPPGGYIPDLSGNFNTDHNSALLAEFGSSLTAKEVIRVLGTSSSAVYEKLRRPGISRKEMQDIISEAGTETNWFLMPANEARSSLDIAVLETTDNAYRYSGIFGTGGNLGTYSTRKLKSNPTEGGGF